MARVLVVDDEPAVLQLLLRSLEARGHDVVAAPHARKALELVKCKTCPRIDLVVSDVLMPDMNGPELVREIAQEIPGVAALFISGLTAAEKLPAGAAFLRKPFSLTELMGKVDDLLQAGSAPEPRSSRVEAIRDRFVDLLRLHAELGATRGFAHRRELERQTLEAQLKFTEILGSLPPAEGLPNGSEG